MKTILFRTTLVMLLLALGFAPVYAHHGTEFLNKAMEANATEVKLGELAETKSQNQRVKDFAMMLVKDHTMALDKMQMLLDARVNAKVANTRMNWHEMKLNATHQQAFDKLSKMSGPAFDREFIMMMTTNHQNAIKDFETHMRSHGSTQPAGNTKVDWAMDTDTAGFARETLPTLRHHLEEAQNIQKEMKGGTPVSRK